MGLFRSERGHHALDQPVKERGKEQSLSLQTSARLLAPGNTLEVKQLMYGLGVQTMASGEWPGPEDGDTWHKSSWRPVSVPGVKTGPEAF